MKTPQTPNTLTKPWGGAFKSYVVAGAIIGAIFAFASSYSTPQPPPQLTTNQLDTMTATFANEVSAAFKDAVQLARNSTQTKRDFQKYLPALRTDNTTIITGSMTNNAASWCVQITDTRAQNPQGFPDNYGYYTVIYNNYGLANQSDQRNPNFYSCKQGLVVKN